LIVVNKSRMAILKCMVWAAGLTPLGRLVYLGLTDRLTANPIEFMTLSTGTWTLLLLFVTLSITPLRNFTRLGWLIHVRRLTGLFAFFYGLLHFITYVWLDKFFDFSDIAKDVIKRPFITAGFVAFILIIPLALTSSAASIRRLGEKGWQWLHRAIYPAAAAAVVHYWWKVKADTRQPMMYAAILVLLLTYRAVVWALHLRSEAAPRR
jgi:methionine sulfoxide reductase heme-binding subunit